MSSSLLLFLSSSIFLQYQTVGAVMVSSLPPILSLNQSAEHEASADSVSTSTYSYDTTNVENVDLTQTPSSTKEVQDKLINTNNIVHKLTTTAIPETQSKFITAILSYEFIVAAFIALLFMFCCVLLLCFGVYKIKINAHKKKQTLRKNISISHEHNNHLYVVNADKFIKNNLNPEKDILSEIGVGVKHLYKRRVQNITLNINNKRSPQSKSPLSRMNLSKSINLSIPNSLNVECSESMSDDNLTLMMHHEEDDEFGDDDDIDDIDHDQFAEEKRVFILPDDHMEATQTMITQPTQTKPTLTTQSKYDEYLTTPTEITHQKHKLSVELNLILPDDNMDASIMTHSRNNISNTNPLNGLSLNNNTVSITKYISTTNNISIT